MNKTIQSFLVIFVSSVILVILFGHRSVTANDFFTPRRDSGEKIEKEVSYFAYPMVYTIPGAGSGAGAGVSVLNLMGEESTINYLHLKGDWEFDSIFFTGLPLFTKHLRLNAGYTETKGGAVALYERGPKSSKDPVFTLEVDAGYATAAELSLNFFENQLEFYYGFAQAVFEPKDFDNYQNKTRDQIKRAYKHYLRYSNVDSPYIERIGSYLDNTDDRRDPHKGYRVQFERLIVRDPIGALVESYTDDINFTTFLPRTVEERDIFVFNLFHSHAVVTKPLKISSSKQCNAFQEEQTAPPGSEHLGFTEDEFCEMLVEAGQEFIDSGEGNKASASPLGGSSRLRGYPIGRFHDRYVFFTGLEYRSYFFQNRIPFNYILEKGVFKALQWSLFAEAGQVAPSYSQLFSDFKTSFGTGLRLILDGIVFRGDFAAGAEGNELTAFVGYPF